MASIQKRNKKYAVVYTYEDDEGRKKQKWESFGSYKEAKIRKSEVENNMDKSVFIPPSAQNINDFLDLFIDLYGVKKWAPQTYESNLRLLDNYVRPIIGDIPIQKVNTLFIDKYYSDLLKTESAGNLIFHKKKNVSTGTVNQIHKLLKCAFNAALNWNLIGKNPFLSVDPPKHIYKKRQIWTSDMIIKALNNCEDPKLSLCIHLSFACSLRIGEILALQWKNVHISGEDLEKEDAHLIVDRELTRANVKALEALNYKDVYFVFLDKNPNHKYKTKMIIKKPKTESSIRKVWIPNTLARILREWKTEQDKYKDFFGGEYTDYDLVVCFEDGRNCSESVIMKGLKRLIDSCGLPPIVFHSFRHTSTTYKLKMNHGDIKATQGDTGHSQADMVTEIYSHILDEDRKVNAQKMDDTFYKNFGDGIDHISNAKKEVDIDSLVDALKQDPKLMTQLIEALK